MVNKRIFVLGVSGLTGLKAAVLARTKGFSVSGTYNLRRPSIDDLKLTNGNMKMIDLFKLDLRKEDELRKLTMDLKPDIILNCAALHNVDYCESHPNEAYNINAMVVKKLAALANGLGSRLVHISTDFIFGGERRIYKESDTPMPLSVYAKSKLLGETAAKSAYSHAILRPSIVYGWTPSELLGAVSSSGKPMNFALWVLHKLSKNEDISVVDDQYASPTLADTLAEIAIKLAKTEPSDLFHVAGTSCINRYEFTKKIARAMNYDGDPRIKPIRSNDLKQAAMRPMYSCLDCSKVERELHVKLLTVDESLLILKSQVENEAPHLLFHR